MGETRDIPEPIKRQVRQECCFGCVMCGSPLFQYDHMVGFAESPEHKVENLVLLCGVCHPDKTHKRISVESVRRARLKPFNLNRLHTAGYRLAPNHHIKILLGTNESVIELSERRDIHHVLWISGESYLAAHFEDGAITFSMKITDAGGRVLLAAERGEVKVTTQAWDYRYEGTTLKIWNGPRQILLEANLSNELIHVVYGVFMSSRLDGFVVEGGALATIADGEMRGISSGSTIHGCAFGSWGIANAKDIDFNELPTGFGVMQKI
ncbi:HNH endonuclease signature motif containing protein [Pseudomonas corrugata]|uniref:HNH endonuclease n=1 Tax=Pseudomonas corrugata TaxID=47879 RepID=UPI003D813406